jgi:hypothetical protein
MRCESDDRASVGAPLSDGKLSRSPAATSDHETIGSAPFKVAEGSQPFSPSGEDPLIRSALIGDRSSTIKKLANAPVEILNTRGR